MSINTTTNRNAYIGQGLTSTFQFTFKIYQPSELKVISLNVATGVETLLNLNQDYTVTGAGNSAGGSITLTAGNLGVGTNLTIVRNRQLNQQTDLRNQGTYYPEVVEDTFDMMVMNDQQQQAQIDSSLKLPTSIDPAAFSPVLPALTPVGASLIVNSTGTGFASGPTAAQLAAGIAAGTQAATSATNAANSASQSVISAAAALASQNSASASVGQAQTFASQASSSATNASTSASTAQGAQTQSQTFASQASTSATSAQGSASAAAASASQANTSQSQASSSASNASNSAATASNASGSAQTYAGQAQTSASNAATSATNAANSASQASSSASIFPTGGTTGQVLVKNSNTNYDTSWTTNSSGLTALTGDVTAGPGAGSQVATITNLARTKIASGTASQVLINDASGNLSSEAALAKVRGGTGVDNTNVTFPSTGTIPILPTAGFVKSSGTALTSQTAITLSTDTTGILPASNGGTGQNSTATYPTSGTVGTVPASGFVKSSGSAFTSQSAIGLATSDVSGILPATAGGTGQNSTATYPASGTVATTPAAGFVKSSGSALTSQSAIVLTSDVSGLLPSANGGTGVNSTATYPASGTITTAPAAGFVKSSGTALTSQTAIGLNTSDVTGTLPISSGGTGSTAISSGFVTSNGSVLSSSATVDLTSQVANALPLANGGTGATSQANALTNILPAQASQSGKALISNGTAAAWTSVFASPLTTKGDVHTFSTTDARLAVGSLGQVLTADSTQATGIKWAFPASAGGKNYLGTVNGTNLNGNFELGATTGFSLATATLTNGVPSAAPTAGAASFTTFAATSTTPLEGTYSLSVAGTAAFTAGQGFISTARTIDLTDQARVLSFSFSYKVMSGAANLNLSGTTANSFGVFIYDVTNAVWIQPSGCYSMTQSTGVGVASGSFQTSSNGTSYQIAVMCTTATAGASALYFDAFTLGPQSAGTLGATMTDWKAFTPVTSWTTNTTPLGHYRRVGDSLEMSVALQLTGAPNAANLTVNVPTGFTIDTSKLDYVYSTSSWGLNSNVTYLRNGSGNSGAASLNAAGNAITIAYITTTATNGTYPLATITQTAPSAWASGDFINVQVKAPIVGWSSNAVQSSDANLNVVATRVYSSAQSIANNTTTQIIYTSIDRDATGSYSTSTGLYTVSQSGWYIVYSGVSYTTTSTNAASTYVYKNGANASNIAQGPLTNGGINGSSAPFYCNAGDTLGIWTNQQSGGAMTLASNNITATYFGVQRLSGPATVQATESVIAIYTITTAQSVAANAAVLYANKIKDSHSAYAPGTGLFTAPISGTYKTSIVSACSSTASASIYLKINGVGVGYLCVQSTGTSGSSISYPVLQGQTIGVYYDAANTAVASATNGPLNQVTFERTGNY